MVFVEFATEGLITRLDLSFFLPLELLTLQLRKGKLRVSVLQLELDLLLTADIVGVRLFALNYL